MGGNNILELLDKILFLGNQMHSNIGDDHSSKLEIEVNESLVGAIIGPGGRSIVEIQQYSGTFILNRLII